MPVVFAPEAQIDLLEIYDHIADESGAERAIAYVERIQVACHGLETFPARGARRDDIRPGLRVIGVERRVAVAFHQDDGKVVIDRILYGGRDFGPLSIGS